MATYRTEQGEAWDEVSVAVYGTEARMNTLLAANPDYQDQVTLPANVELTVPELSSGETQSTPTPPWEQ